MWSSLLIMHLKRLCCAGKYQSGGTGTSRDLSTADLPGTTISVISGDTDGLTIRSHNCCLCWVACFPLGFYIFPCWQFLSWIMEALGIPLVCSFYLPNIFLLTYWQFFSSVQTKPITAVLVDSYTLDLANGLQQGLERRGYRENNTFNAKLIGYILLIYFLNLK